MRKQLVEPLGEESSLLVLEEYECESETSQSFKKICANSAFQYSILRN